jgi:hypothetical protein
MDDAKTMKTCIACRRVLPMTQFDRSARSRDGLMVRCSACNDSLKADARARYAQDPKYRAAKQAYSRRKAEDPESRRARAAHERARYAQDAEYRAAKQAYIRQRAEDPAFRDTRAAHERERYAEDSEYKKAKQNYHKKRSEEASFKDARAEHERSRFAVDPAYRQAKRKARMARYWADPQFRVDINFSSQIRQSLAGKKANQSWERLVGYTLSQLMKHLESQFDDRMNWENYGEWHIDHRKPRSWFTYESTEHPAFKACWSLTNLQPKWGRLNISKGNRFAD